MDNTARKILLFPNSKLTVIKAEETGAEDRNLTRFEKLVPEDVHPVDFANAQKKKEKRVEGFVSIEELDSFVEFFLNNGRYRDALLTVFGCNTGLRISDIIWMRWKDIYKDPDTFYDHNWTVAQKGAKIQMMVINEAVKQAAQLYRENLDREWRMDDWIFVSESGRGCYTKIRDRKKQKEDRTHQIERQPMLANSASRLMTAAAKESGLFGDRRISTHSLRKSGLNAITGGLIGVEMDDDLRRQVTLVKAAQEMGGHSSSEITVNHYLTDRYRIAACIKMNLGLGAIKAFKERVGDT